MSQKIHSIVLKSLSNWKKMGLLIHGAVGIQMSVSSLGIATQEMASELIIYSLRQNWIKMLRIFITHMRKERMGLAIIQPSSWSTANKAVLSPSAGTAIPLALHVSPKPRRYA